MPANQFVPSPVEGSASDVSTPAANAAAVVTYAGRASVKHVISGMAWSYDGDPTGGNLQISDDGDIVFSMDITTGGAGFIAFPQPKKSQLPNTQMVITLAAGGAGVSGKLSVMDHWMEQ